MKRFVNPFVADGSSASVIESGLIIVLVGLACITAWMHVGASLNIPSVSTSMTMSVETTGSVRSQELHRASRTRRLRRSHKRLWNRYRPYQGFSHAITWAAWTTLVARPRSSRDNLAVFGRASCGVSTGRPRLERGG